MLTEGLVVVLVAAVAINVAMALAVIAVIWRSRDRSGPGESADATPWIAERPGVRRPIASVSSAFGAPIDVGRGSLAARGDRPDPSLLPGASSGIAYDRIIRIAGWTFIVATGCLVAASGVWPATQPQILGLLAAAAIFIMIAHDALPSDNPGSVRTFVECAATIGFATVLVALTGGTSSPFFFVYVLIVASSALVLSPRATFFVTAAAILGYLAGVGVDTGGRLLSTAAIVTIVVNAAALVLLAYVFHVVAREQRRARDAAIELSTLDPLTGLYNRAYLFSAVDREIQRSTRSGREFCLIMLDLDDLKLINDRFGHFQGDRVLRGVAEIIRHGVRRIDTATRYGGDEFVVLLPETELGGAFILAEKIRQGVRDLGIETPTDRIRASLSIGLVSYPQDGQTADELMISADQAMYASKRRGKNRIVGYAATMAGRGYGGGSAEVPTMSEVDRTTDRAAGRTSERVAERVIRPGGSGRQV